MTEASTKPITWIVYLRHERSCNNREKLWPILSIAQKKKLERAHHKDGVQAWHPSNNFTNWHWCSAICLMTSCVTGRSRNRDHERRKCSLQNFSSCMQWQANDCWQTAGVPSMSAFIPELPMMGCLDICNWFLFINCSAACSTLVTSWLTEILFNTTLTLVVLSTDSRTHKSKPL